MSTLPPEVTSLIDMQISLFDLINMQISLIDLINMQII
jgi:hypothetical protein